LGDQNLRTFDDGADPVEYKVKKFIKHKNYNELSKENDIALIELEKDVTFSEFVLPTCLHQSDYHGSVTAVIRSIDIFLPTIKHFLQTI
jgi:Trypsin